MYFPIVPRALDASPITFSIRSIIGVVILPLSSRNFSASPLVIPLLKNLPYCCPCLKASPRFCAGVSPPPPPVPLPVLPVKSASSKGLSFATGASAPLIPETTAAAIASPRLNSANFCSIGRFS